MTRDHVSRVKGLLGERGYYVFPLSKYRRHSSYDFVAIPRNHPPNLVVATIRNGRITVRPFLSGNSEVEKALSWAREKFSIPVYWNKRQIPLHRPRVEIEHLLTPKGLQQLKILIPEIFINRPAPVSQTPLRGRMRKVEKRNKFGSGRHMWQ